ncbi:MAG TPA: hypothetical protein DEQ87_07750 [Algoriphagus sp.]|jgi:hypothetical protein|uniref:hypothetical protein n=1 Tax=unclassified Algoriphagus TaxID=2641541 RepID=UPI000C3FDBA3|nr:MULTISPECIES: hypothetical protein [unclassified Algoriphagus]MAL13658.1 hypothetical protein [Algoriphagus sp.]QYH39987.1 hypothetical protein GYM62_14770 [Algoriphagus sp. NBT04N3]HAH37290.1 hypothetical protein [Algoriphagus sp.]HAS58355.1 hypothetical protein [Algoriphagus sp.]HAZ26531.1 hypothetical protein [Algoriphagus sp.]|tara:strand:- start:207 stop:503 length:297 start_codon:yes stop_codon:yes gene_type:complete
MASSLTIAADLTISSETHELIVLSDSEEIGIAINGNGMPNLGISTWRLFKLLRSFPKANINQRIRIVYNQKEIYRSDKSLLRFSNVSALIRLLFSRSS